MRLSSLTVRQFRGIRDQEFKFDSGEGILIYGPNGTGKSAIFQAIEYLLTGTVEDLTGEGAGQKPLRSRILHKDEADDENFHLSAKFDHEDQTFRVTRGIGDDEFEVERCSTEESDTIDTVPEPLSDLRTAVSSRQNILARDELLNFIDAPDRRQSRRLNKILRMEDIDEYRKNVQGVVREFEKTENRKKNQLSDIRDEFFDEVEDAVNQSDIAFDGPIASNQSALEAINEIRLTYDAEGLSDLDEGEFSKNITEPSSGRSHPLTNSRTVSSVSKIVEWIDEGLPEIQKWHEKLKELKREYQDSPELRRDIRSQDLLKRSESLVDKSTDECPLCLKDWGDDDLAGLIDSRLENVSQAQLLRDKLKDKRSSIISKVDKISQAAWTLANDLDGPFEELTEYAERLRSFADALESYPERADSSDITQIPYDSKSGAELAEQLCPESTIRAIRELDEKAEQFDPEESQTGGYDGLVRAHPRYLEYCEHRKEHEVAQQRLEAAEGIEQTFLDVRKRLLSENLTEIKEEFVDIVDDLGGDVPVDATEVTLEPKDHGIRFRPPFHDGENYQVQNFYSEGQQDAVGIALFLAMCQTATGDDVDLVLLDDVLSSMDSQHRAELASVLNSLDRDYQLILTTHDKVWSRHLEQTDAVDNKNVFHFTNWGYECGVQVRDQVTNPEENIESHLEDDDVTAAAAWIRKTVEYYGHKGCENFGAEVRYDSIENLTAKDYLEALKTRVEEILREGAAVAQRSRGRDSDDDNTDEPSNPLLDEFDAPEEDQVEVEESSEQRWSEDEFEEAIEKMDEVQDILERNIWALNNNVHYSEPEQSSYSREELRGNWEAFRQVFDIIRCEDCDGFYEYTEAEDVVECDCGEAWRTAAPEQ